MRRIEAKALSGGYQRVPLLYSNQVTLNSCERRYTMIGIYDCFGYGPGYTVSFEESKRKIFQRSDAIRI